MFSRHKNKITAFIIMFLLLNFFNANKVAAIELNPITLIQKSAAKQGLTLTADMCNNVIGLLQIKNADPSKTNSESVSWRFPGIGAGCIYYDSSGKEVAAKSADEIGRALDRQTGGGVFTEGSRLYGFAAKMISFIFLTAAKALNWFNGIIALVADYFFARAHEAPPVQIFNAWEQIRNIVNVIFVLLFMVIAAMNVFGIQLGEYAVKKVGVSFLLSIVAVNFSFAAVMLMIDVAPTPASLFKLRGASRRIAFPASRGRSPLRFSSFAGQVAASSV